MGLSWNWLKALGGYFKKLALTLFGQLKASAEAYLTDFVKTKLGAIAFNIVDVLEAEAGLTPAEKKDQAVEQLKQSLSDAGDDIEAYSTSQLNWFVETALQAVRAKLNSLVAKPELEAPVVTGDPTQE